MGGLGRGEQQVSAARSISSHSAGAHPTIAGWPTERPGFQAGDMTHRAHEKEPDTARQPPAEAASRCNARRPRGELWESLGMALVASGLCLAAVRPDLRDAAVHMLAATAAELAPWAEPRGPRAA